MDVPPCCLAAKQRLPESPQPKQNYVGSGTPKMKVNPTQVHDQMRHPLASMKIQKMQQCKTVNRVDYTVMIILNILVIFQRTPPPTQRLLRRPPTAAVHPRDPTASPSTTKPLSSRPSLRTRTGRTAGGRRRSRRATRRVRQTPAHRRGRGTPDPDSTRRPANILLGAHTAARPPPEVAKTHTEAIPAAGVGRRSSKGDT